MHRNVIRWYAIVTGLALAACGGNATKPNPSTHAETHAEHVAGESQASAGPAASGHPHHDDSSDAIYEGTITGVISDSMCGADHARMGDDGKDPSACTKKCVAAGAKYVLVDAKGDVYALSDQNKPEAFAGKPVAVTGHIDPKEKSIHVHSLTAP